MDEIVMQIGIKGGWLGRLSEKNGREIRLYCNPWPATCPCSWVGGWGFGEPSF